MKEPQCDHYQCHDDYRDSLKIPKDFKAVVKWSVKARRWVGTCRMPDCKFQIKYVTFYPTIFTTTRHMRLAHTE